MKILIIVMGILSLFSSCTGRKVKLTEEDKSVQNGYEVEENKSCLDYDTLSGNMFSSNKGNDTIGGCPERFNIAAFERHKKDIVDKCYEEYREILNDDTLREYGKYMSEDDVEYSILEYHKDSYLCYQKRYYKNGNIKSRGIQIIGGDMYTGISRYYSIDGKLQEEVNEDEGYLFTFEQLMHCLEEKGIYFPKGVKLLMRDFSWNGQISKHTIGDSVVYVVTYTPDGGTKFQLVISGKDGSIINEYQCVIVDN